MNIMSSFLQTYNYLNLNNPTISLELLVWSIFIGIVLGALASLYNKRVLGGFVRALIKNGANSPVNAVTVGEAGFSGNIFVKFALKRGTSLRKVVYCSVEPDIIPKEKVNPVIRFLSSSTEFRKKINVKEAKFYIPSDMMDRAELRYEKKGTDLFSFLLTVLVFLVVVYLSLKFIPDIIGMVDSFITDIMPEDNRFITNTNILNFYRI